MWTTYVGVAVEDGVLQRAEDVSVHHLGLHIHGEARAGLGLARRSGAVSVEGGAGVRGLGWPPPC